MDRPESPAAFHRGVLPLAGPYPSSSSPHAICFMFVAQCEDTPWAAGAPLSLETCKKSLKILATTASYGGLIALTFILGSLMGEHEPLPLLTTRARPRGAWSGTGSSSSRVAL
eukprot:scaffold244126_cov30-Tisochrysis_lutea.AAC.12